MSLMHTTDWSAEITNEDLRSLALILDYASEQAQKLALSETSDLITRASRSLEIRCAEKFAAPPIKTKPAECASDGARADTKTVAWQTPEYVGGPIILDDVA